MRRPLALLWLACCLSSAGPLRAEFSDSGCALAASEAERAHGLPQGLLLAVGLIESGRPNPGTRRVEPWPWTINAAGTGQFFASKAEAAEAVGALEMRGVRSIDVGCFQVNVMHHPFAFASIAEALDPTANARYAAEFLSDLHSRLGAWPAAVAAYHSATPSLGESYRDAVLSAWQMGGITPRERLTVADAAPVLAGMHVFVPSWAVRSPQPVAAGLPRVITPAVTGLPRAITPFRVQAASFTMAGRNVPSVPTGLRGQNVHY